MNSKFLDSNDVAKILGVSKSYAYKVIKELNNQLKDKGFITVSGKICTKYFYEKTCYGEVTSDERR